MRDFRRYVVRLTAIAAISIASLSCTLSEASHKSPERLARAIWDEVNYDLNYINIILKKVILFDNMLAIEDEAEREAYLESILNAASYKLDDNTYTILYINEYNNYHTQVIKTSGGRISEGDTWEVSYSGALGYTATITPAERGYKVEFSRLYDDQCNTTATLDMKYKLTTSTQNINALVSIEYTGSLALVDYTSSISRPLTIDTTIEKPMKYDGSVGMVGGRFDIVCRDRLYDTTDKVQATITESPQMVTLSCMGAQWTVEVRNRTNL